MNSEQKLNSFMITFMDDDIARDYIKAYLAQPTAAEVLETYGVTREEADALLKDIDQPMTQEQMHMLRSLAESKSNTRLDSQGYGFSKCPDCGKWYRKRSVQWKDEKGEEHDKDLRCPACHPEDGVAELADVAKAQQAEILASMPDLLKKRGVRAKNQSCRFESFALREGSADAFQAAKEFVTNKDTVLLLIGPTGVGKTHLAVSVMAEFLKANKECKLIKEAKLGRDISDSRCFRAKETINEMHDKYCSIPLLVIDELGQGTWTNGESTEILDIIDDRIEEEDRKTILLSNMSWQTFSERFGDRIVSRLDGYGKIMLMMDGDNRRKR